jgi:hypothetical protein
LRPVRTGPRHESPARIIRTNQKMPSDRESQAAEALAHIYLREAAAEPAFRRQLGALARRRAEDATLVSHLGRNARRIEVVREEIDLRGGRPPSILEFAFRALGSMLGAVTSLGGERRTLRALGDGARALGKVYGAQLSEPMPPQVAYRLAGNFRDVLILADWVEDRLTELAVERRAVRKGRDGKNDGTGN